MTTSAREQAPDPSLIPEGLDDDKRKRIEQYIEEEEGASHKLSGPLRAFITALAVGVTLFHLYAAIAGSWPFTRAPIVPTYLLRPLHVGMVLMLAFLMFPMLMRWRNRVTILDWLLALLSLAIIAYIIMQGDEFGDRAVAPDKLDVIVGIVFIALLLEATRRTTGLVMPIVALLFLAYALAGPYLPQPWTHRGYAIDRLVGQLYMTLEGIFGTAVDVSSSLIILFTIFGAILQYSGAGKFFIDFSLGIMGGKRNAAGRTVVLSSFLMGGPSGSGVATTVTIGAVAAPMLEKAGYEKNAAGGLLAAGGLGAIISPPVLGAAAFLIAEFLKISYFDVILMATIPTVLYYFGILVMVELDSRKYGGGGDSFMPKIDVWDITKRYWFHFGSLISIIVFMLWGFSPVVSVFWATMLAIASSFLSRDTALFPPRLVKALAEGTTGVLNAATTCASAGIIVGVVTLTGLGLKFSSIAIDYAGGSLLLTAIYTALIVWIVGLAVPVTASYIICAVIAAPALTKLGVPDYAAHMFIFYYAVLSEVSPPTALSPFAAAAITGGSPYRTTLQSWKYTMPAFLVPFIFVLDPMGTGLLLKLPKGATWLDVAVVVALAALGIIALAIASQAWLRKRTNIIETLMFALAGTTLLFPRLIDGITSSVVGLSIPYKAPLAIALFVAAIVMHRARTGPTVPEPA
ncbi:MAG TPA: TRAP transporter fused permease subunit [Hyphomicrobiaceae bacterium]|nr:TRAP transporter fused permease subunit [Hyphomicrobiaceae bacterium]